MPKSFLAAAIVVLAGCSSLARRSADQRLVEAATQQTVALDALADHLAAADVVFLGEVHTSDVAHQLQAELFERLIARRPELVLSLEMFERDVQPILDAYLEGNRDEQAFLAEARPWKTYEDHYRALIELARKNDVRVVAANLPRATARVIAKEGLVAVADDPHLPDDIRLDTPAYRERFEEAMREHGDVEQLDFWFAAQVAKDESMAAAIAEVFERTAAEGEPRPLVVHVCGRFHSDFRLGTVERLVRRRPELVIETVSTVETQQLVRALTHEEQQSADWVWLVRPSAVP